MKRPGRKADAITPAGADQPIPPRPARVPITPADQRKANAEWDAAMKRQGHPEWAGLLDAEVTE